VSVALVFDAALSDRLGAILSPHCFQAPPVGRPEPVQWLRFSPERQAKAGLEEEARAMVTGETGMKAQALARDFRLGAGPGALRFVAGLRSFRITRNCRFTSLRSSTPAS